MKFIQSAQKMFKLEANSGVKEFDILEMQTLFIQDDTSHLANSSGSSVYFGIKVTVLSGNVPKVHI